jgi:hypothetical protein
MTTREPRNQTRDPHKPGKTPRSGGPDWLMIACCVPMLAVAAILFATGVLSGGFLIAAVACTVMMAIMMRGMNDDDSHR